MTEVQRAIDAVAAYVKYGSLNPYPSTFVLNTLLQALAQQEGIIRDLREDATTGQTYVLCQIFNGHVVIVRGAFSCQADARRCADVLAATAPTSFVIQHWHGDRMVGLQEVPPR